MQDPTFLTSLPTSSVSSEPNAPISIQGKKDRYELLQEVNLNQAAEIQKQTGRATAFMPSRERASGRLGAGAFGETWMGRTSAEKYITLKKITGAQAIEDSQKEAEIQLALTGLPYLMPLQDSFTEGSEDNPTVLYHVMPLAGLGNGEDLAKHLQKISDPHFKQAILIHIAKGLILGMQAMHAKGFAHNDLKPNNFVLQSLGDPCIIDFGCATHLGQIPKASTPYWSPTSIQQATSKPFLSQYNDLWTLGMTLAELAIGSLKEKILPLPNGESRKVKVIPQDFLNHPPVELAAYAALVRGLLEIDPSKQISLKFALEQPIFQTPIPETVPAFLQEWIQTLAWQKRLQEEAYLAQYKVILVSSEEVVGREKENTLVLQKDEDQEDQIKVHFFTAHQAHHTHLLPQSVLQPYEALLQFPGPEDTNYLNDDLQTRNLVDVLTTHCGFPSQPKAQTYLANSPQQLPLPHFTHYVHRPELEQACLTQLSVIN